MKRALVRGAVDAHFFQNRGAHVSHAKRRSLLWARNFGWREQKSSM
jgi:hypothetical protein